MEVNYSQGLTYALILFIIIMSIMFIGLYRIRREYETMDERLEKRYNEISKECREEYIRSIEKIDRMIKSFKKEK